MIVIKIETTWRCRTGYDAGLIQTGWSIWRRGCNIFKSDGLVVFNVGFSWSQVKHGFSKMFVCLTQRFSYAGKSQETWEDYTIGKRKLRRAICLLRCIVRWSVSGVRQWMNTWINFREEILEDFELERHSFQQRCCEGNTSFVQLVWHALFSHVYISVKSRAL